VIAAIVDHGEYFATKLCITGLEVAMVRRTPDFRHVVYP
jgi:hypothetical protein